MTTTENSRADALTDEEIAAIYYRETGYEVDPRGAKVIRFARAIIAASPSSQPAQADAREGLTTKEQVELFAADLVKRGELVWGGFRQDAEGQYTIPELTPAVWTLIDALLQGANQ